MSSARAVLLIAALTCAGCAVADADSVPLVIISPHRDEIREEVALAFRDWWRERNPSAPPVRVVWQDIGGGTSQIVKYVRASFEANPDGIGVDLIFGGGTDIYLRMSDEGLLQPVEVAPAILQRIPPDLNGVPLYDPKHRWYGPMLSSFGILYNRRVLKRIEVAEPRAWADLCAPQMQGWVSAGDPRMTGSVHMVYEIILQSHGWDDGIRLLLRMGANTLSFIRDSGTLTRTVTSGEVAAAGNIDVNALSAVGRDPEMMGFVLPAGETIINPDAVAVLKGAPHADLARGFVEFTLSDPGQKLFFLRPGEPGGPRRYPLCRLSVVKSLYNEFPPDVRSTGTTNPFGSGERHTIRYDSKLGIRRWDALNDLFGAWVVDAHPDLVVAWRAVLERPAAERDALEAELFDPPCTQEELLAYSKAILEGSPRTRTEMTTRWGEEARERYRRVQQAARK